MESTVTEEDLLNGVVDGYGVVYSTDGRRLLKCGNEGLTQYTVKEGTKTICDEAFDWCWLLTAIELPEGLTSIGERAFDGCSSLESIDLPKSLTSIGKSAFRRCEKLTTIKLPDSVTDIGDEAFIGCWRLKTIKLLEGVTEIGKLTFWGCKSLEKVYIGCSDGADEEEVLEKFKGLLPEELQNTIKIEVVWRD